MQEQFYRTGQAAKQLGISTYRVRALCESGAIADAELTDSGQWIVPAATIQKLLREGVPPTLKTINTTAPAISGGAVGRAKAKPKYNAADRGAIGNLWPTPTSSRE